MTLKFKKKSSALNPNSRPLRVSNRTWPLQPDYFPYTQLKQQKRVIDCFLTAEELPHLGVKYSCFELAEEEKTRRKNKKSRT